MSNNNPKKKPKERPTHPRIDDFPKSRPLHEDVDANKKKKDYKVYDEKTVFKPSRVKIIDKEKS